MPISSCPTCEIAMEVQNFEDVLFDICPSCKGVWLDRGEMQKVIAHVRRQESEIPSAGLGAAPAAPPHDFEDRRDPRYEGRHGNRRKKRSLWDLLEDLIDD
jgi:Zn-finger nucleic acid-binding protein